MPPSSVVHFSVGRVPIPKQVYLDTSFVLRCYYARHTPKGVPPTEAKKNSHCNGFLAKLYGSTMHTSLLTVEEAFHRVYFKGHILREATNNGLYWKKFRNNFPTEYKSARSLGLLELKQFVTFIDSLPIKYIEATSLLYRQSQIKLVKKYARLVLQKYETLEPMDTFHIALMRVNRIEWFVTAEEHIASPFDEFSVFTL